MSVEKINLKSIFTVHHDTFTLLVYVQGLYLDTILTAESLNSAGELYGNYSMGPVDAKAELNGTRRVACLQVKCPAFDRNGSDQYTTVRVAASARYGTCRIRYDKHTHTEDQIKQL